MADNDFVMVQYTPVQRGSHGVVGVVAFRDRIAERMRHTPSGWVFDYGHPTQGDVFLVHRADVQAMPGRFMPVQAPEAQRVVRLPAAPQRPTVRPPAVNTQAVPVPVETNPAETQPRTSAFDPQILPGVNAKIAQSMLEMGFTSLQIVSDRQSELTSIPGVGASKAQAIISRTTELLSMTPEDTQPVDALLSQLEEILSGVDAPESGEEA